MSDASIDRSRPVRSGEEIDAETLFSHLAARIPEIREPLVIEQFPSGHSNLTYLVRSGAREYVLRRPPFGAKRIKSGHDMAREFTVLSRLIATYPKVPRPAYFCPEAESPLGAEFYLMERVTGVILRAQAPKGVALTPDVMRRLSENFIDNLARLHATDLKASGLDELWRGDGYVRRQVDGWTKRYRAAQTDDVAEIETVIAWIGQNVPPDAGPTLIHNDYKYDNLALNPSDLTEIIAVLDWEMATVGDPLTDLAMALAYWVDPDDPQEFRDLGFGLTALPGNLRRTELLERYVAQTGRDAAHMTWHYAFALFKVAGIIQQIYYRYRHGFTRDERFARMGEMTAMFGRTAERVIATGRIGH
jgi:aminoglycoside phosphotransferase (APT) family kinase protein